MSNMQCHFPSHYGLLPTSAWSTQLGEQRSLQSARRKGQKQICIHCISQTSMPDYCTPAAPLDLHKCKSAHETHCLCHAEMTKDQNERMNHIISATSRPIERSVTVRLGFYHTGSIHLMALAESSMLQPLSAGVRDQWLVGSGPLRAGSKQGGRTFRISRAFCTMSSGRYLGL